MGGRGTWGREVGHACVGRVSSLAYLAIFSVQGRRRRGWKDGGVKCG